MLKNSIDNELIPTSDDNIDEIVKHSWSVSLNHQFPEKVKPFQTPRLKQAIEFIPLTLRYFKFLYKCRNKKTVPPIDFLNPIKCQQIYGAPIGGIGCGTIGRSYSGDFCRYQLVPGIYEHEAVDANMFTVCIRRNSNTIYQQSLSTKRSKLDGLKSWNMAYCGDQGKYYAYYPQSWTVYNLPGQNVKMTLNQLSPIIPHDYKDSSLPLALFNWTIENKNDYNIDFSLMFTWQSGSSSNKFELSDVNSEPFDIDEYETKSSGVLIHQKLKKMSLDYCIAAKKTNSNSITYSCQFYATNEKSGHSLWMDLLNDGQLNNNKYDPKAIPNQKSKLAVAVCVQVHIKAKSSENIDFSLVWNMPNIRFNDESKLYKRFYSRYFEQNDTMSQRIACYALSKYKEWKHEITEWQNPILIDKKLPEWYKRALFNELYFISDGGTVWIDVKDDSNMHKHLQQYGRFAYLEGHEYRMFNTYDVHFYASFALIKLWPNLQLSIQYDYAQEIPKENPTLMQYLYDGVYNKLKTVNSVPHDLGDPNENPWTTVNAYNSHDTKDWKDLNLKFILTVYRDYYYLKDIEYLKHMWPLVKIVVVTIQEQDNDGDGLIDSTGRPDQTYDAWSVTGASAYVGGLHIAVLQSCVEMAKVLDDQDSYKTYFEIYERAKKAYNDKLWNGSYYNYDSSNNHYKDSIMADMCCGHWYLRCSGFKYEAFEAEKIKSCLEKIYEFNIVKYGKAKMGAVNGMRPNGEIDITSLQSEEMWVGVTDSIAALMIYEGMDEKAWETVNGLYELCYNRLGLAFQMPEALMRDNLCRSLGYMRALGIWAIQYAIDQRESEK